MIKKKGRKPVVLIVDDDKQVLKSLKIWLRNEGFRPLVASHGDEAIALQETNPVEVALVDYRMSEEDGIGVARRLSDCDELLKIVMLTGFPSYETAVKAMKVGIFDYISKGSSNEKILDVITKALAERDRQEIQRGKGTEIKDGEVRVVLFCNHSLLKERLENYSKSRAGFKLIRSFATLRAVGVKSVSQQIDIALICGGCNLRSVSEAYTVLPELYRAFPGIKPVIINENFSDPEKVELLKLGVKGFSSRDLGSGKLEEALHQVQKGEIWVSRNVTHLSLKTMANLESTQMVQETVSYSLTDREVEILRTMALGLKNKEIAEKLFISEKTVKTHVNRIFKKLKVTTRAKAIFTAVENKLI